ncbi:hypothetical protein [Thermogemmatispora sp.]|uniref:rolling circle replication-associated protein n=1 Tax=Thermogemmatispora sp. TaxID=1968838 RepID=UPI0035E43AA9
MGSEQVAGAAGEWPRAALPTVAVERSARERLADGTWRWFVCGHPWALRHRLVSRETGEMVPMRCGRWSCRYCGPRKVLVWRRLIEQAEPALFVTLTRAGRTLQEASRALTTWVQAVRRGSRREGRPAYRIEYLAVPEWHRNGWLHWHVLIKGVAYLPHGVISELWRSATRGRRQGEEAEEREAYVVYVERVRSGKVASYVTKYLLKAVGRWQVRTRRLRYSRRFFEQSVAVLRRLLCGQGKAEEGQEEERAGMLRQDGGVTDHPPAGDRTEAGWLLWEWHGEFDSVWQYRRVLERVLRERLEQWRAGEWKLSRFVIRSAEWFAQEGEE